MRSFNLWLGTTALLLAAGLVGTVNALQFMYFQNGFLPQEMFPVMLVIIAVWFVVSNRLGYFNLGGELD